MQPLRLLLIRHAEAGSAATDADRPLTERGARHAAALGAWLAGAGIRPDRVVVSEALRARQTWERASAALPPGPRPVLDPRVYDNTPEALLESIGETPGDVRTLVLVGHNPSVTDVAHLLDDGDGDPDARRGLDGGFRPGAVAVFDLDTARAELGPGMAVLRHFAVPD